MQLMNKFLILITIGLFTTDAAFGQAAPPRTASVPGTLAPASSSADAAELQLTKFDLDFPAGTPGQLVKAIEKSAGRPLNAIVPAELANVQLPALKMKNVNVAQLFEALQA